MVLVTTGAAPVVSMTTYALHDDGNSGECAEEQVQDGRRDVDE